MSCKLEAFNNRERTILQCVRMPVMLLFPALERILQLASAVAQRWTSSNFSPLCLAHISHDGATARSMRAVLMGPLSPLLWPQLKLGRTVTVTIYHNSHNFSCAFFSAAEASSVININSPIIKTDRKLDAQGKQLIAHQTSQSTPMTLLRRWH